MSLKKLELRPLSQLRIRKLLRHIWIFPPKLNIKTKIILKVERTKLQFRFLRVDLNECVWFLVFFLILHAYFYFFVKLTGFFRSVHVVRFYLLLYFTYNALKCTIHSVEIREILSHAFLTKISWKQQFY